MVAAANLWSLAEQKGLVFDGEWVLVHMLTSGEFLIHERYKTVAAADKVAFIASDSIWCMGNAQQNESTKKWTQHFKDHTGELNVGEN